MLWTEYQQRRGACRARLQQSRLRLFANPRWSTHALLNAFNTIFNMCRNCDCVAWGFCLVWVLDLLQHTKPLENCCCLVCSHHNPHSISGVPLPPMAACTIRYSTCTSNTLTSKWNVGFVRKQIALAVSGRSRPFSSNASCQVGLCLLIASTVRYGVSSCTMVVIAFTQCWGWRIARSKGSVKWCEVGDLQSAAARAAPLSNLLRSRHPLAPVL